MPDLVRRAIIGASDFVWGPWTTPLGPVPGPLMVILILTGVYLTVRTGFVQVRRFPEAARTIVPEQAAGAAGALSPFQAFMTALAASIGTGNIAGVATAIVSGGPGALFWIWAYGFIAMAIKFAEAVLAWYEIEVCQTPLPVNTPTNTSVPPACNYIAVGRPAYASAEIPGYAPSQAVDETFQRCGMQGITFLSGSRSIWAVQPLWKASG